MTDAQSHRWKLGLRHGPWRATRDEALEDAVAAGLARYEDGTLWKDEMLEVEEG